MQNDLLSQSLSQLDQDQLSGRSETTRVTENEKARRLAHWEIMLTLWAGMTDSFGYSFSRQFGTAEEDTIKTWARALYRYSEDVLPALNIMFEEWSNDFPPTLPEFRNYVALAYDDRKRRRKEIRAAQPAIEGPRKIPGVKSAAEKEAREKWARIARGEEVEPLEESLNNCFGDRA